MSAESPAPGRRDASVVRKVSLVVAEAVGCQAMADGVVDNMNAAAFAQSLHDYMWEPEYVTYERMP